MIRLQGAMYDPVVRISPPCVTAGNDGGPAGFPDSEPESAVPDGDVVLTIVTIQVPADRSASCHARPEYPPAPWLPRAIAPRRAAAPPPGARPAGPRQ